MKDRICDKCTFYYPKESGWQDKCLQCRGFAMLNHIKENVLPYNKCDYFRERPDYANDIS